MKESKFHMYSIGVAAENLISGKDELEICPIERLGFLDGEITSENESFEDSGVDADGNVYTVKIESGNSLKAKWFPFGSNRATAPDIRRGMRVIIWKYADGDIYFWTDTGLDQKLFRKETVVYVWSNAVDDVESLTPENSWFFKISTHEKTVTFATNKSDGETHSIMFQANIADSSTFIKDDLGNYFEIDPLAKKLELKTAGGSMVSMIDRNITVEAPENLILRAKNIHMRGDNAYMESANLFINGASMMVKAASQFLSAIIHKGKSIGNDHRHRSNVPGTPTDSVL